jgi:hypothetical protein
MQTTIGGDTSREQGVRVIVNLMKSLERGDHAQRPLCANLLGAE